MNLAVAEAVAIGDHEARKQSMAVDDYVLIHHKHVYLCVPFKLLVLNYGTRSQHHLLWKRRILYRGRAQYEILLKNVLAVLISGPVDVFFRIILDKFLHILVHLSLVIIQLEHADGQKCGVAGLLSPKLNYVILAVIVHYETQRVTVLAYLPAATSHVFVSEHQILGIRHILAK